MNTWRQIWRSAHSGAIKRQLREATATLNNGIADDLAEARRRIEKVLAVVEPCTRVDAFTGAALMAVKAAQEELAKEVDG